MSSIQIIQGDCREILKTLPDCSVDAIVTDPPAGIGFMDKEWDDFRRQRNANDVGRDNPFGRLSRKGPQYGRCSRANFVEFITGAMRECLRVLKPGGHAFVWSIPRTSYWTAWAIEDAGFEVRDFVTHLFGTGQPKNHNCLKPGAEVWWLARRPLEGNVENNVKKYGLGPLNIDGCRVGGPGGRWPANVVHDGSEEVLAGFPAAKGGKKVKADRTGEATAKTRYANRGGTSFCATPGQRRPAAESVSSFFYCAKPSTRERNLGCEGLLTWENTDLSRETAELSQHLKVISESTTLQVGATEWSMTLYGKPLTAQSLSAIKSIIETTTKLTTDWTTSNCSQPSNINGCIRDAIEMIEASGLSLAESAELISQLKLSSTSAETVSALGAVSAALNSLVAIKEKGRRGNTHSTVKPLALMQYLCRLITPPGGVVLDPFAGSGTTLLAARAEGFSAIGIEREAAYIDIINKRLGQQ